jgi:membrane protein DedA with SNARE-associated domain
MMYSPTFASMYTAPFVEYIGQANAVAISMLPGALILIKLGEVIQKKRWHETNLGLAIITVSCIVVMFLLRCL